MSPSRPLQLGSVLWAELEDSNGYRKVRPVVVVSPTADIKAGKPMRVVAITTRLPDPLPDDYVSLPWDRQGKARSGLRRRCAAVASWQAEVPVRAAQQVVGILPPAAIRELLAKLASVLPLPLATTDPTPPPGDSATLPSSVTLSAHPPTPEILRAPTARAGALNQTENETIETGIAVTPRDFSARIHPGHPTPTN